MSRGIKYGQWSEDEMERAIAVVRNGDMGLNAAAKMYCIPKTTLKRHVDGTNSLAVEGRKVLGSQGDIPLEIEHKIAEHALKLEACFFGITVMDLRRLAYQVAERNSIPHRFNTEKEIAGKKWYSGFMKRNPDLSLRVDRATSMARAVGFNRDRVNDFFDTLEKTIDEHQFDATRIFNVDETGLTTVQKRCQKVIARKGKNQIGSIASGERGLNTTAVCCVSASGRYIPLMMIYNKVRGKDELRDGAPPGTIFAYNPESGYINKELFITWLELLK